ncbi:transporter substrate-binding domain-containing protein [Paenibacillus qinlingensis]|uniref:Cystine transport system substrate-binding protein n=1 Tax=Paenibacillus qinlingensis TaxID=1837343 RepID=A0ABU1NSS0_9BACL|nr:transporter substrate-binding domain-containing protein [Paenibacillus qinlingensis]MDR6550384.1 cystine transport system substrate-binding protein [Paenibacillus qinlingensis]
MSVTVKKIIKGISFICVITAVVVGCSSKSGDGTQATASATASATPKSTTNAATSEDLLASIKKSGKIKIGLMGTYAPYNFLNDKHEVDGFDADVAKEVAKRIGVQADFITGEFSGLIEGLQTSKYDALVTQVTITDDRKKTMDFSTPYIKNSVSVIVKNDNTSVKGIEDFKGKKIGVGLGTNDETYLRNEVLPKVGTFNIVTYNDVITSLTDLNAGRIDATINNVFAIQPLVEKNHFQIKTVGASVKDDFAGIAIRKNNAELLSALNNALTEMKSDGTFKQIFQKWFKVDPNI